MKLMLRCKELFVIRIRILRILKSIQDRERILDSLKKEVQLLNEADEKDLENIGS
jgi:hypothetical protein